MGLDVVCGYLETVNYEYYHKHGKPLISHSMIYSYGRLLYSILNDNKIKLSVSSNPFPDPFSSDKKVEEALAKLFRGRKVLEVGCRHGGFLFVLQKAGAIVKGTTGGSYLENAREILGKETVVNSSFEELGNNRDLQNFHPDFLISANVLDRGRWEKGFPLSKMVRGLYRITGANTKVYLTPSLENGFIFELSQLQKIRRIWGLRQLNEMINKKRIPIVDIRFRVARRSRKKIGASKKPSHRK